MGVIDAADIVAGIERLIDAGVCDPSRVGLTGISHGGFLAAWMATQHPQLFAAVAPVCPITDWNLQRLTTNIPSFNARFLQGQADAPPCAVAHIEKVRAPMLLIAGGRDQCTPPSQAQVLHAALRMAGKQSELVVYPMEGHGIRGTEAKPDYVARVTAFFRRHLTAA